jgi:hypothetical protein
MAAMVCSASVHSWCGSLRSSGLLCGVLSDIVSGMRGGRVRPADRYIRHKPRQLRAREQNTCTVKSGDVDQHSNDFELHADGGMTGLLVMASTAQNG